MIAKEEQKGLPFKVREKWLRTICERCAHAFEQYGCNYSGSGEEYRKDCLHWTRKLRGKIEPCSSFDEAFRTAFDRSKSIEWYGYPVVNAWELAHYIMNALGWSLSEVEAEIRNIEKGVLDFPGSPPFAENHYQKIDVGSIYGRTGYIGWRTYPVLRKCEHD